MTLFDGIGRPHAFRRDTIRRQSEIEHFVGDGESCGKLLASQLDAAVRIEVIGAAVFRKLPGQIHSGCEQVVDGRDELMAADTAEIVNRHRRLPCGQPF